MTRWNPLTIRDEAIRRPIPDTIDPALQPLTANERSKAASIAVALEANRRARNLRDQLRAAGRAK